MKQLFYILFFLISTAATAQTHNVIYGKQDFKDSLKFSKYRNNAAEDSVLTVDRVTGKLKFKLGTVATTTYTNIDSSVVTGTTVCLYSAGVEVICFTLPTAPGDTTIAGIDSFIVTGNQGCNWKGGVVISCYTISSTINNITNVTNIDSSRTIVITQGTGVDSVIINGYMVCFWDSGISKCWQLNRFFDDVRLSDDSAWYKFYNDGIVIDSVPSGIKNVGAVWPLSYDGVDLTTSKPFNDSLYLSSLVKHSDSLFSKKLTGDSVFVGLMSGSGGSGTVTSIATGYGLSGGTITSAGTIIADSTVLTSQTRTTAGLALKENFVTAPFTTLKYATGYKTFGSFYDTARAAVSLSFSATGSSGAATGSYSNSTGVFTINVPTYTLAGLGGISLSSLSATGTGISYNNATGVFTGTALIAADTVNKYPRFIAGTNITFSGTYPNITIAASGSSGITGSGSATRIPFWDGTSSLTSDTTFRYNVANHRMTVDSMVLWRGKNQITGNISLSVPHGGLYSLQSITNGSYNVFFSTNGGSSITSGGLNVGVGSAVLLSDTSGSGNTGVGSSALFANTSASDNTAVGLYALTTNTTGPQNTAIGSRSLRAQTTPTGNTGVGYETLSYITTQAGNTAIGKSAGSYFTSFNTMNSVTNSVFVGSNTQAGANGLTNVNVLGYAAIGLGTSNSTVIGNSSVTDAVINGSLMLGTTTPVTSALLNMVSTTKGLLMPAMTTTNRDAISSPATLLQVGNTTQGAPNFYNGTNWVGALVSSSAGTLTLKHGEDYIFTGTTTTWTLPAVSSSTVSRINAIKIKNRGSGSITLNSNAGSTLYTTSAQSTITIVAGAACELLPDGTYFNVMFNL